MEKNQTPQNAKVATGATEGLLWILKILCVLSVLCVLVADTASAVPTVRTMYNDALAREEAVRPALAADNASTAVLTDVRAVVARYELLVRHYPASSYCDNALWQAGHLALDAFERFHQPEDRDHAARLFRRLADGYPSSKLAKQVPDLLVRVNTSARRAAVTERAGAEPTGNSDTRRVGAELARSASAAVRSAEQAPASGRERPEQAPPVQVTNAKAERATDNRRVGAELARPPRIATIKDIRRSVMPDAVRVVIELDGEVSFHDERIPDPSRVFVDLPGTRPAPQLLDQTIRYEGDADIVRQVRLGRHPNSTTRVVLDATGVSSYSVYPLYEPYRLVIDCMRATPAKTEPPPPLRSDSRASALVTPLPAVTSSGATAAAAAPIERPIPPASRTMTAARKEEPAPKVAPPRREPLPIVARQTAAGWLRIAPSNSPQHGVLLAEAHSALPERMIDDRDRRPEVPESMTMTVEEPAPVQSREATMPAVRNSHGGFSIARQLGLGVSRIVIDAGHGGHDPGAQARGVVEAELVLDVALRVETLLQKVQGVEVILTRRTDDFIALQERTGIANREGADLFLSIHANANSSAQAHGVETYFLNFASNLSAAAVAARENAASGQAMGALPDIVKAIALNNKLDESRDFAVEVQRALMERLRTSNKLVKDLGVKQAPFVVLIGAAMPSVLAEISFVTNPQEAKLLKSNVYRQRIAEALFNAIRKYQGSLRNGMSVASPQ